ncbi:MAG: hypothetical protein H0Z24_06855 [Thermosipho sp. (in: Bacteria)]|nr:hypothetical protein [Thermosipho sp. (in: thermotogales)]
MNIYELIKRIINSNNPYVDKDVIQLQIEFFYTAGKLTQTEYDELITLLGA